MIPEKPVQRPIPPRIGDLNSLMTGFRWQAILRWGRSVTMPPRPCRRWQPSYDDSTAICKCAGRALALVDELWPRAAVPELAGCPFRYEQQQPCRRRSLFGCKDAAPAIDALVKAIDDDSNRADQPGDIPLHSPGDDDPWPARLQPPAGPSCCPLTRVLQREGTDAMHPAAVRPGEAGPDAGPAMTTLARHMLATSSTFMRAAIADSSQ